MDVSIIIPTYNRLWCLPEAIKSCRGSECEAEIIVVDDGSTDGTWEWLQKQSGITPLRQQNRGKGWAANFGFAAARGEYVRFLDSDDWLLNGTTDRQLAIARATGADVVVAGYQVHSSSREMIREQPWIPCDDFIAQQLGECDSSHYSAYLSRRGFIKDIPHRPEAGVRDDRMFVLELALKEPKVAIDQSPAFAHRHHQMDRLQFPTGLRAAATNYQHLQIYRRTLDELSIRGELTVRRKRAAVQILWPLAHWIAYSHHQDATAVVRWIYELDPSFVPPERGMLGWMYRNLGFGVTEKLLWLRRSLAAVLR